jgi:D-3-phosphoglycerate dehydrogenase
MEVLAVDPYIPSEAFAERGACRVASLRDMLPRCAALSVHCPLTGETRGMLGEAELELLPFGAVLVNTARGSILDEDALLRALDSGRVSGAALDVYPVEPPPPGGVLAHPRVLPTAHIGGHSIESHGARAESTIGALGMLVDELLGERGR